MGSTKQERTELGHWDEGRRERRLKSNFNITVDELDSGKVNF